MKKMIVILLSIIICFSFCSCGRRLNMYEIYVCKTDSEHEELANQAEVVKYNKVDGTHSYFEFQTKKKSGMKDITFVLGDVSYQLSYDESYKRSYSNYMIDIYRDQAMSICVDYRADTGKVENLYLADVEYPISNSPITSEEQLKEVSNNFVKDYVDDISKYRVSVETTMDVKTDHVLTFETFDEFVSSEGYEDTPIEYKVHYNYYIDDVSTYDLIVVTVKSDGNLRGLTMEDVGCYDKYASIDIDETKCDSLIEEQTNQICTVDNYQYTGYSNKKRLVLYDGVLCMLVTVTHTYEEQKNNEGLIVDPIEMLIPIAK